jgi:hypothetical protein
MCRIDRIRQSRNCRFHCVHHDTNRLWRKTCVRKVLHLVGPYPGAVCELNAPNFSGCSCGAATISIALALCCSSPNRTNIRQIGRELLPPRGLGLEANRFLQDRNMQNRVVRIDPLHSRAICAEIAERLRISLSKDQSPPPTLLRRRLDQLREIEEQSPSIVPSMRNDNF